MNCSHSDENSSSSIIHSSLHPFLIAIQNFKNRFYKEHPDTMQGLLQHGQNPKALMISCCDSRVDPALLVDAAPGDLFVVRNVANLVPPYQLSDIPDSIGTAIEYAVRDLKVQHIIIMGHAHCGGIKALLNMASGKKIERDYIGNWVSIAEKACHLKTAQSSENTLSLDQLKDYPYLVERAAIEGSINNLMTYPWIKNAVSESNLELHGWWYDLETGDLWVKEQVNEHFMPIF